MQWRAPAQDERSQRQLVDWPGAGTLERVLGCVSTKVLDPSGHGVLGGVLLRPGRAMQRLAAAGDGTKMLRAMLALAG
jgi:hypothetical protein